MSVFTRVLEERSELREERKRSEKAAVVIMVGDGQHWTVISTRSSSLFEVCRTFQLSCYLLLTEPGCQLTIQSHKHETEISDKQPTQPAVTWLAAVKRKNLEVSEISMNEIKAKNSSFVETYYAISTRHEEVMTSEHYTLYLSLSPEYGMLFSLPCNLEILFVSLASLRPTYFYLA